MRILLTGANGVMGRATIPALQSAGHELVGLVRSPSAARVVQSAGATAVHGDVLDRASLLNAMRGCDAVIARHELDGRSAVRDHSLRWILVHLVEETSRHLGHLDLLCELADGRTGEEPEGAPAPGVDEEPWEGEAQ